MKKNTIIYPVIWRDSKTSQAKQRQATPSNAKQATQHKSLKTCYFRGRNVKHIPPILPACLPAYLPTCFPNSDTYLLNPPSCLLSLSFSAILFNIASTSVPSQLIAEVLLDSPSSTLRTSKVSIRCLWHTIPRFSFELAAQEVVSDGCRSPVLVPWCEVQCWAQSQKCHGFPIGPQ
jgi:hypothetical protein